MAVGIGHWTQASFSRVRDYTDWANLASVELGISKFTVIGAPIDFWTSAKIKNQ